jgi:hypothetical protein
LIVQVPAATNVTTPADIEHTDDDPPAIVSVGASDASLTADTVYVPPTVADDGGDVWNVNT